VIPVQLDKPNIDVNKYPHNVCSYAGTSKCHLMHCNEGVKDYYSKQGSLPRINQNLNEKQK
jgi:hypothetical protein